MLARTAQFAAQRWMAAASCSATSRGFAAQASGPTSNQYPPPDPTRLGTADLCDVYHPTPVDEVHQTRLQIVQAGLFKDFGGHLRFRGKAATVKCFEVRHVLQHHRRRGLWGEAVESCQAQLSRRLTAHPMYELCCTPAAHVPPRLPDTRPTRWYVPPWKSPARGVCWWLMEAQACGTVGRAPALAAQRASLLQR